MRGFSVFTREKRRRNERRKEGVGSEGRVFFHFFFLKPPLAFALNAFAYYLSQALLFRLGWLGGGGGGNGVIPHETARFAPPLMSVRSFVRRLLFAAGNYLRN